LQLPLRDGVAPSTVVVSNGAQATVLDFLTHRLPVITRQEWAQRLAQGGVLNEEGQAVTANTPSFGGQRLYYYRHRPDEAPVDWNVHILFQDAHLVVADKPHGLPVTPTGRFVQHSLLVCLRRMLGLADLSPLHRIDRETAGLVVFAIHQHERGAYQALFRERRMYKVYEAIAATPAPHLTWPCVRRSRLVTDPTHFFKMIETEGDLNSETRIDCLGPLHAGAEWARYRLEPTTGQRHQLRVHMQALGLPLMGDRFYPVVRHGPGEVDDAGPPLLLLAQQLAFTDPITGQSRHFHSQIHLPVPPSQPPPAEGRSSDSPAPMTMP
jgi:tRNA pseudouridine32 synthase/23S rRNA pseudouridine746 synthase